MPAINPKLSNFVVLDGANPAPGDYYVSVIDGPRYGLLLGPFRQHQDALDLVEPVREIVIEEVDPRAHFYGFGTCKLRGRGPVPPGLLNEYFAMKGGEV